MKALVKPIFLLWFVSLPQLALLAYLFARGGLHDTLALPAAMILLFMGTFSIYGFIKRHADTADTRIFIAVSAVYTLLAAAMLLYYEDWFTLTGLVSPRLILVSLCIIPVLHGIYGIAFNTSCTDKRNNIALYVAGLVAVPLLWFIVMNLLNGINSNAILMIFIIASVYAITLLMFKMLLNWKQQNPQREFSNPANASYYIITLFVSLLLPLGGLALNQKYPAFWDGNASGGMFGDFSSPAFFVMAVLNGLFMLLPVGKDKALRLLLFYLKAVSYTYILYFFIVFFPLLPLGALGLIYFGLGIFIFVPAAATVWQGMHMVKEAVVLAQSWGKPRLAAVFCIGMITLPICLLALFSGDRGNFESAALYLDRNNTTVAEPVDLARLERTLANIRSSYSPPGNGIFFRSGGTPILSAFYAEFVLDKKVISQHNILALENLFFDSGHNLNAISFPGDNMANKQVRLTTMTSKTTFDEKLGVYRSWIDLSLENSGEQENREYATTFKLPQGAYVSDYYLDVAGYRKEGILSDRRAALSIYQKILNTRRDPGLLHYVGRNTLELRVFPFARHESRETGFEILHINPFILTVDHQSASLGSQALPKDSAVEGAILLSPGQKAGLRQVARTPQYYFVIDGSKSSDIAWHIEQIEAYAQAHNINQAKVMLASYKVESHSLADMKVAEFKTECGFNLDRAVRMILRQASPETFPVIIAVSDNMPGAVFPENIYPLSDRFPESAYYYALNHDLTLTTYAFENNQAGSRVKEPVVEPILDFNGTYVADNDEPELVLRNTEADRLVLSGDRYKDAILLDAAQQNNLLNGNGNPLELVRASFRARILTPQTAFIVVETEDQEKELLALQERILNNNEPIPGVTLDEPPWLALLLVFMIIVLGRKIWERGVQT